MFYVFTILFSDNFQAQTVRITFPLFLFHFVSINVGIYVVELFSELVLLVIFFVFSKSLKSLPHSYTYSTSQNPEFPDPDYSTMTNF